MRKVIPNVMSLLRMALVPWMLLVPVHDPLFWVAYVTIGLTDLLDGWLARRWGAVTKTGALLDSAADALFFLAILVLLFIGDFLLLSPGQWYILWAIVAVRLGNLVGAWRKYGRIVFVHTWANKAAGFLVYLAFPLVVFQPRVPWASVFLVLLLAVAVEEALITWRFAEPNVDRPSIFSR